MIDRNDGSVNISSADPIVSDRPGPQPHNQIAGTVEEQLRRAQLPRINDDDQPITKGELRAAIAELEARIGGTA